MGWVKKNLADGRTVKGVIVVKSISSYLRHAIVAVPYVSLFEYEVALSWWDVNPICSPPTQRKDLSPQRGARVSLYLSLLTGNGRLPPFATGSNRPIAVCH
jgi:hypothetical protein